MKKFMRTFLNAAAIPAVAFLLAAPSQAAVNLKVHKEVLPNGLTVLLHPNSQAPTVSCRLFYVTGSVHEVPGKSGLAHILEHELFKGTKKVGIQRLRFYVTGTNLFVITNYPGYDPEVSSYVRNSSYSGLTPGIDFSSYPKSRAFTFGVNVTL